MKKIILSVALAAAAMVPGYAQTTEKTEYVVVTNANGNRIFTGAIDYDKEAISFAGDNVIITVKDKAPVTFAKSQVAEINIVDYPVADLFDAVWNADGTAKDLGKFNLAVTAKGRIDRIKIGADNPYGIICPTFDNEYGIQEVVKPATWSDQTKTRQAKDGTANAYYHASYAAVTDDFAANLGDGYAAELIFKATTDTITPEFDKYYSSVEIKPFSSTQSGGFGFSVRPVADNRCIAYISGTGANTYYSAKTMTRTEKDKYYHVITVWNKSDGLFTMFVNGEKAVTVEKASGTYCEPKSSSTSRTAPHWIGIGADPTGTGRSESSFPGQVVVARMYDQPLTDAEVQRLFQRAEEMKQK